MRFVNLEEARASCLDLYQKISGSLETEELVELLDSVRLLVQRIEDTTGESGTAKGCLIKENYRSTCWYQETFYLEKEYFKGVMKMNLEQIKEKLMKFQQDLENPELSESEFLSIAKQMDKLNSLIVINEQILRIDRISKRN